MDDLSVAYDYDIILDGDKPACLTSQPVRTCRAAQFVLFIICLDLCGCRVLVDATSRPRGDRTNRITRCALEGLGVGLGGCCWLVCQLSAKVVDHAQH